MDLHSDFQASQGHYVGEERMGRARGSRLYIKSKKQNLGRISTLNSLNSSHREYSGALKPPQAGGFWQSDLRK